MRVMSDKRAEGWGNLDNARDAHYFVDGSSLCGRWLAFGEPRWESNQELGSAPSNGTCKHCWKKAAKLAQAKS
jgi:hypothetical protein